MQSVRFSTRFTAAGWVGKNTRHFGQVSAVCGQSSRALCPDVSSCRLHLHLVTRVARVQRLIESQIYAYSTRRSRDAHQTHIQVTLRRQQESRACPTTFSRSSWLHVQHAAASCTEVLPRISKPENFGSSMDRPTRFGASSPQRIAIQTQRIAQAHVKTCK